MKYLYIVKRAEGYWQSSYAPVDTEDEMRAVVDKMRHELGPRIIREAVLYAPTLGKLEEAFLYVKAYDTPSPDSYFVPPSGSLLGNFPIPGPKAALLAQPQEMGKGGDADAPFARHTFGSYQLLAMSRYASKFAGAANRVIPKETDDHADAE